MIHTSHGRGRFPLPQRSETPRRHRNRRQGQLR